MLQWQGKVQINSSFFETELVNEGMTEDVVGKSNNDNHNDDDSENLDKNDDGDDVAQNSDEDVKPFDAATTQNRLAFSSRGVHAQRISADSNSHD